jgi:acetyl-CoA acetyltransferase
MSIQAVIAGAAETRYSRRPGSATADRLAGAVRLALLDAGLDARDVDGLGVASFSLVPDHAIDLAWRLGLRVRWIMEDTNGGASALNMLQHALRAIEVGDASVIVLVAGDALRTEDFRRLVETYNTATRDVLAPLPTGGPNALFALVTRRHMEAKGLRREHYGHVAVAQRAWAALNPGAVYRAPLTLRDYLEAPLVADPLGLYDCVPVVAGADALVLTAAGRARRRPPIRIRAIAALHNHDHQEGDGLQTGLVEAGPRLWEAAELGPAEVDVVSVYDDYPVMVLVQLEELGFVPEGDVARFVEDSIATRSLAVNTSGGQLSAGQAGAAGGMHGLVESVRQLRRDAGARQVEGATTAVATGYGMVLYRYGACAAAAVLERGS